jgi:hypothetical protein
MISTAMTSRRGSPPVLQLKAEGSA